MSEAQPPTDDDAVDLDDLDAHGVEGVVAAARGGRAVRPVWISLIVLVLAIPLLVRMYPDFRYWLQPAKPVDLGQASALVQDGRVKAGYRDAYVVLHGTPDVRNVALARTRTDHVRYMRLLESNGDLFAVVRTPREVTDGTDPGGTDDADAISKTVSYPGTFEGRLVRLGDLGRTAWNLFEGESPQFQWLERFYELENVTRTIDSDMGALVAALERGQGHLSIESEHGPLALGPDDRLRIVVQRPEARVLVGSALLGAKQARARVAELGYPFVMLERREPTRPRPGPMQQLPQARPPHRFVVRIPEAERASAQARLESAIANEVLLRTDPAAEASPPTAVPQAPAAGPGLEASPDPHRTVSVLPTTATFTVAPEALSLVDGKLRVPLEDGATAGYDVVDGTLRERTTSDGHVSLDPSEVTAVRIERPVRLDPDGYALVHGETPKDARLVAMLWLFTLVVALGNGALVATRLLVGRR